MAKEETSLANGGGSIRGKQGVQVRNKQKKELEQERKKSKERKGPSKKTTL